MASVNRYASGIVELVALPTDPVHPIEEGDLVAYTGGVAIPIETLASAAAAAAAFVLSSAVHAAEPVVATPAKEQLKFLESKDPQLAANKKLVWDMWRTFLSAHHIDEADKYLAPEYHQHNPNAETGLAGVKAYFKARNLPAIDVPDHIEGLISMVAERDLVTLALAREYKVSSLHVTFAPEEELAVMREAGFLPRLTEQYHWKNDGYGSFDDFLAAPVGRCPDLVAPVSSTLRRMYGDQFLIAPLSVLVDPIRAQRVLGLSIRSVQDSRFFTESVQSYNI